MERDIERILRDARTVAVVGFSPKADRASFRVAHYLQRHGYHIIPVNPTIAEGLGERAYPDLDSIAEKIDVVDVFRRSEDVPGVVEQAIRVGARVVWMQEGIANEDAAAAARKAGLEVVMDRCMMKEHHRLHGHREGDAAE